MGLYKQLFTEKEHGPGPVQEDRVRKKPGSIVKARIAFARAFNMPQDLSVSVMARTLAKWADLPMPRNNREASKLLQRWHKAKGREAFRNKHRTFSLSREWRDLRARVLEKHPPACMRCGVRPPPGKLHVDHIKPRSKFPELALREDNLQLLCEDCNQAKGSGPAIDYRSVRGRQRKRYSIKASA